MSNLGSGFVGSMDALETKLAAAIAKQLQIYQSQLGLWTVVWGPAVFQERGSVRADNAMFVAQSGSDPSEYIVSIAGSNFYSAYDWVVEDIFVRTQIPWQYGSAEGLSPALARGTDRGLTIVQQLTPGPGLPGQSLSLQSFLQQLPPGPFKITIAGHSLGGALSPVTALWLSDTKAQWDPTGRATLSCLPSAGPTPGNQDFATYYQNSPLGNSTTRIHNSLDVVPHAWATSDLAEIPTLYQPDIEPDILIRVFTHIASQGSKMGNYTQLTATPPLIGVFTPQKPLTFVSAFPNLQKFIQQMAYQHVEAYLDLLGLGQLDQLLQEVRDAAVTGLTATLPVFISNLLRQVRMAEISGLSL
jgi:hypothetical protein